METNTLNISTTLSLQKPIVLVGLMGCGKSAIGKRLASMLSVPFVDSDHHIVESSGMSITDIFEQKGEDYFRQLERDTLHQLMADGTPKIIATGGGAFINDTTRILLLKEGLVIWIKAEYDVLLERVSRKTTRPLLEKGDKAKILKTLMNERYPIYAQAPLSVESADVPHEVTLEKVIKTIQDYYDKAGDSNRQAR